MKKLFYQVNSTQPTDQTNPNTNNSINFQYPNNQVKSKPKIQTNNNVSKVDRLIQAQFN